MKRFKNILCIVGADEKSVPALERAVALAENNQADLTVATVVAPLRIERCSFEGAPVASELQEAIAKNRESRLQNQLASYRQRVPISVQVLTGTAFLETIRQVLRNQHDIVIKVPESSGWGSHAFSSDDKHLLRKCPCPVWMVKSTTGDAFDRILATVDVDDSYPPDELMTRQQLNETVADLASSLAVSEFAELHVAHAWEAVGEDALRHGAFMQRPASEVDAYVEQVRQHHARLLDEFVLKLHDRLGDDVLDYTKPVVHMPKGEPGKVIPELARDLEVDCVVMGTVARTGIPGLIMGNTAETILDQIACSVLAVKPPGFVTPVVLQNE